ncbi:hypothetical protein B0H67DRAFT_596980 [Lasiosphaeris hirsuta]|uniref:Uncharacterized protein n=1 Tax=Lasiosphaeris hirsuta TaxID=260670 RepID=A0AA40EBC1_9PEZI|nr:hypothetical protein B0H67DRAFT_596980 [Lasiosphaeris hirsuta]
MIPFWTSGQTARNLPPKAYSPLEGASAFASSEFGIPIGGMSTIQLLRYTDTPAGPYDELILAPGYFEYPVEAKNGKKATRKSLRITRIYVSQKQTCWNGRTIWNIPKHLARFEWTDNPDGSSRVRVFPHDTHTPYDASEARPSDTPFFQCTIKPMSYVPSFPMTTSLFKYMGVDMALVQPPLPQGETELGELPGTERWAKLAGYIQYAPKASLAWADMSQKGEDGTAPDEYDNFFPGLSRWNVAVKLVGGGASFPPAETWEIPKGVL